MKNIVKLFTVMFICVITFTVVTAGPVTKNTALSVAKNFFRIELNKSSDNTVVNYLAINSKQDNSKVLLHVYYGDNSFIVISGDNNAFPIIAYSNEGSYPVNSENASFNWWMSNVTDAVELASTTKTKVHITVSNAWDLYTSENKSGGSSTNTRSVNPFLLTKWDQAPGYNALCPSFSGTHCVTGCVATSMAQIMKYYNYPKRGQGSHSYVHPYFGTLTANFDTLFDFQLMTPPAISNSLYPATIERLMYACGVSVDMNYTPNESGAQTADALNSLYNYFKYRRFIKDINRGNYTDLQWRTYLLDNLDMGYPILYSGADPTYGGHAWVCDGYQNSTYFHFNWGWSGGGDGYFYLNSLTPMSYNFTSGQGAIINIVADTSIYPYCIPNKTYAANQWTFDNGTGTSNYSNNTNCQWLISPDSGDYIQINFNRFQTEANKDFVTIYDGPTTSSPILCTLSGNNIFPAPIVTSSSKALVVFTTDAANTLPGWELTYTSLYKCLPHAIYNVIDTIFDNGSGIYDYPNNLNCNWNVNTDSGKFIQLVFQKMNTELNKDILYVYNGDSVNPAKLIGAYSGTTLPQDIFSTSNKLYLVFTTDNANNNYTGWQIEAISLDSLAGVRENNIIKGIKVYPNPAHNMLNITGDYINDGITKFSIYDVQSVRQYTDESNIKAGFNSKAIDVSTLRAGMYILKIENNKGSYYMKFIIQ
ncbi:MAG: C10 family peptidase [Bacteroidota bacterium]